MRVFLRKFTKNDTKKQIETTVETYIYFFDGDLKNPNGKNFKVYAKNGVLGEFKISKAAGSANSFRFASIEKGGESFASFINRNTSDKYQVDDILIMYNSNNKITLDIIKPTSLSYDAFDSLLPKRQNTVILTDLKCKDDNQMPDSIEDESEMILVGYNKIYYGIPGCGKSYYIEHSVLDGVDKENVFRTTFYLDYSNSDFIGQIYPVVKDGNVTYEPIPGPFTKALERALINKNHMVYLVIEEINRGNAAAIFGDIFQLLDRLKTDENGRLAGSSEYPISNSFIEGYFEQHGVDFNKGQIVIPNNLTILATMNTSDQNVFPLDTAFKRRWDRERVVTDWGKDIDIKGWHVPCTDITWENFATTINEAILETDSNSDVSISEDKQMGAYFAHKNMLTEGEDNDGNALISFTNNVIDYLYNDVTKFNHSLLFEKGINSFNDLYNRVTEYTKSSSDSAEPDVGPHAVLYKLFNEDIVKKLEDNAKKDKGVVKTNIETNGNKDEGTEN